MQTFLSAGLINEITISLIPVLIGDGIPPFGPLNSDVLLQHISTKSFPSGLVQTKYKALETTSSVSDHDRGAPSREHTR